MTAQGSANGADAEESVFVRIPAAAARHGALNLAQGVFDHGPEPALLDALTGVGGAGEHQYAPSPGHPALRTALAGHTAQFAGVHADPDTEITVTAGATEALYCTLHALLGRGDEAIVIEPAYESYAPVITATGATVRRVRPGGPDSSLDSGLLEAAVTPATRVIVVNSPWNPLGRAFGANEWRTLAELADRHDITIVSDETYEHLSLKGSPHPGVLGAVDDPERRVKISSVSKTLAATGWRVGWAVTGPKLTRRIRSVHQYVTFCPATPLQLAVADVVGDPSFAGRVAARGARLAQDISRFTTRLQDAGIKGTMPDNGFYVIADVGEEAVGWCERMITDARVAALPLSVFYVEHDASTASLVRFAACKRPETLDEAADRLANRPR